MKRYPVFALVALVFLLLLLLGSWVYLKNYAWPGADSATARGTGEPGSRGPTEDPFADEAAASTDSSADDNREVGGDSGPLKPEEPAETRPAPPPDPVETAPKPQPEASADKLGDKLVAELKPGEAGVQDEGGKLEGLDPLIVSTLVEGKHRQSVYTQFDGWKLASLGENGPSIESLAGDAPEPSRFLRGRLLWPALTKEGKAELKDSVRNQAVVYLERLPEVRAVVYGESGDFVLPVTERMAADFSSKGLRIVVHSPTFEIEGGFEAVLAKKDDGPIRIQLQVAPVLEVTVDVSPLEAVASGLRVWLERRGLPGTPDFDDSLYISARVPESGRLVFSVPEHYGEFRVGATGEVWHSGMAQAVKLRDWKATKVKVTLPLVNERCDRVTGRALVNEGAGIKGVRLESTHFGATVYSAGDGEFDMYLPFDAMQSTRQFLATRHGFRPEVVPLETSRTGTAGVEGSAPWGPFTVTMADMVEIELELRGVVDWNGTAVSDQIKYEELREPRPEKRGKRSLKWGTTLITVREPGNPHQKAAIWIDPADWERAFKAYAAGKEVAELSAETFEKAFKRR